MPTTQRLLTDDTGQALVTAVNNIVAAVKPNATEIQMSSSDTTTVATAITNINNKIGTVPSGQTIEDQITTLNSNLEKKATVLDMETFSSATDVVNYFKQLATNTAYRNKPLFKHISISSPGEPLLFGTSSFIIFATLSSSNYGSLLCVSDNRASGGIKNISIAGNRAFVESFTSTETEISLS